jgi:hypothetical protein
MLGWVQQLQHHTHGFHTHVSGFVLSWALLGHDVNALDPETLRLSIMTRLVNSLGSFRRHQLLHVSPLAQRQPHTLPCLNLCHLTRESAADQPCPLLAPWTYPAALPGGCYPRKETSSPSFCLLDAAGVSPPARLRSLLTSSCCGSCRSQRCAVRRRGAGRWLSGRSPARRLSCTMPGG